MPGKLKEALKQNFEKHFVTFEGLSGSFTNEEEVKNAKKVLNPVISATTKSKDDKFKKVRDAYKSLSEVFYGEDETEYIQGLPIEIQARLDDAKKAIDAYLSGKEYSTDPEYRSVLRFRNEVLGLKSESQAIVEMDENLQKSKEIIENNNKGELGKNLDLNKYWEQFFKEHPVDIPLSRKASKAYENKESQALRSLVDGKARTEGKKNYLDALLSRYDQVINTEKKLYFMEEQISNMQTMGYEYPKEVVEKIDEMKQEKKVSDLNTALSGFENDIKELNEFEKKTEAFAKDRKTFRIFWEKLKKDQNYLRTNEGSKEYVKIQDYYADKAKKSKGEEKKYYEENIAAFTKYIANYSARAREAFEQKIDEANASINRIENAKGNKINEISEIKENFFERIDGQMRRNGNYGSLQLTHTELTNKLRQDGFGDSSREDDLKESERIIKTTRERIKKNIEGKRDFMRNYLDGIDEYNGIKGELEEGIKNIKDMDVDYKGKVAKIYAEEGAERIRNWSARLKAVKSRTFSQNSTEFQKMYDLVDSIDKKLINIYDHENYINSEEYVEDMKKLNEAAKAYSLAKGKAKRSTTQGQERLDIAHEIMGNNTRIESITQELSQYSVSPAEKDALLNDMNNTLKETEEKFHAFCQKCNKTLGIRKLQSEKEGEILSDDELASFSKNPPSMEELDKYAKEEIDRQNRFDLIEASEETKKQVKDSLHATYEQYENTIRFEVESLKKDSLFQTFMEMKKEKSVGKALSIEMTDKDKEKLINSEVKKLDKALIECAQKSDRELVPLNELDSFKIDKIEFSTKSKGKDNLSKGTLNKADDGLLRK